MAALVMGAAIAATGDEVLFFIQPGAAKIVAKGELEKYQGQKGQPDPVELFDAIQVLDGRIILCELGLPVWDMEEDDLVEGVEVMMASTFLFETEGAIGFPGGTALTFLGIAKGAAATVTTGNWWISNLNALTLNVAIDGGAVQTVTFSTETDPSAVCS